MKMIPQTNPDEKALFDRANAYEKWSKNLGLTKSQRYRDWCECVWL